MTAIHTRRGVDVRPGALRDFSSRGTGLEAQLARQHAAITEQDGGDRRFYSYLNEALSEGRISPEHVSIRALFESLVRDGRDVRIELCDPNRPTSYTLQEANVDTSLFANVQGQIVYNRIHASYNDPKFIRDRVCETIPTPFDGEKMATTALLPDGATTISEGAAYPEVTTGEDYIITPSTDKRGFIVPVTKEVVFFDRTGTVLRESSNVGRSLGINQEKRIIDQVTGQTDTYSRKANGVKATYQSATGTGVDWINILASTPFEDWTSIEAAKAILDAMTDPNNSGEPILNDLSQVLVPEALATKMMMVIGAPQVRSNTQSGAETTLQPNPWSNVEGLSSRYVASIQGDATTWYAGDFKMAFAYMQNWPLTVTQSLAGSEAEFTKDIIARYKASERGNAVTKDPRYVVQIAAGP